MEAHSTGEVLCHRHASRVVPSRCACLLFRLTEDSVRRTAGGPWQVWAETRATLQPLCFVWIANIPEESRDDRLHGHVDGAEGDPAVYINLCQSQMESSYRISTKKKEITWRKKKAHNFKGMFRKRTFWETLQFSA